jgi:transposase
MNQDFKIIKTVFMPGQKKGGNFYGEQEIKGCKRENLVAGRRKQEKNLIALIIFKETLNALGFEQWLAQYLLPSLKKTSVLIMDNSLIHRKNVIRELVEAGDNQLLFLPKYSPD